MLNELSEVGANKGSMCSWIAIWLKPSVEEEREDAICVRKSQALHITVSS